MDKFQRQEASGMTTQRIYQLPVEVTNWKFEGYPPGVLYRTGWKRNVTMKAGDAVTIFGWRARNGANWGHSRQVTFADGSKLYFGPPAGTGDGGATPPAVQP